MIFQRLIFFTLTPVALRPLNWIDMGASAISSLAGATLEGSHYVGPLHTELVPFLKVMALFFWVAASWWIPLLLILGVWRHLYKRYPLSYDLQYWGMVFPIGMYTSATSQLAAVLHLNFLSLVPRAAFLVAIAAWLLVFAGMLARMIVAIAKALKQAPRHVRGLDAAKKL
jgi:tellurite resistance protein TehA-like permease